MAITSADYAIFSKLRDSGVVPPRPSILELGEAEWYGDVSTEKLSESIDKLVQDEALREQLHQRMVDILRSESRQQSWDLAKVFYKVFLDYSRITAIDFHGTPDALKIDLNHPVTIDEQFDVLVNGGTAEHVFNVFQFFKTSHELTRPGGLMLHTMPFRGWLDHGFYSFNPTFYWDLALTNRYTVLILAYAELQPPRLIQITRREKIIDMTRNGSLGKDATLYAVLKKADAESEFQIPMQGVYAGTVSEETAKAWFELR